MNRGAEYENLMSALRIIIRLLERIDERLKEIASENARWSETR